VPVLPASVTGVNIYMTQPDDPGGLQEFYGFFADSSMIFLQGAVPAPGTGPAPPTVATAYPDVWINGGGSLTLRNAAVHETVVNNLTMKASNVSGANNVQGDASVFTQAGTLTVSGNINVLAPETTSFIFAGRSVIRLNNASTTALGGNLQIGTTSSPQQRIFNIADGANTTDLDIFATVFAPSSSVELVKEGAGSLVFRNLNGFNGPTIVNEGILGSYNNQSSSQITVAAGTELGGGITTLTGRVANPDIFGTVRPGGLPGPHNLMGTPNFNADTRGILTADGGATFRAGSTLVLQVFGTSPNLGLREFDRLIVNGTLNIEPGTTLLLDLNGLNSEGTANSVITYGNLEGLFSNIQVINNPRNFVPVLDYLGGALNITFKASEMPAPPNIVVVAGKGAGGQVEVYDAQTRTRVYTIAGFNKNSVMEVATGDINGDGILDIVAAQKGRIRVFDGTTGKMFETPIGQFRPFGKAYKGRVYLTTADLNGDANADIIAGKGAGGSNVKAWRGDVSPGWDKKLDLLAKFNAYGNFTGGVRVAAGNFNGVGTDEIYTAPGSGRKTNIRIFDVNGVQLDEFQPFGSNFKKGAFLAVGDIDQDGDDDIVVGPGGNNPPQQVRVFDDPLTEILAFTPFAAFPGPVRVRLSDGDGDGFLDILAARGNQGRDVKYFDQLGIELFPSIDAYDAAFNNGLAIAGGSMIVS
jgi:autotransporter-associated beta strand protein